MTATLDAPDRADADIVLSSPDLDPEVLTAAFGISPTRAWRRGDKRTLTSGSVAMKDEGLWALSASSESAVVAVDSLLVQIRPLKERIQAEAARHSLDVIASLLWFPRGGHGGFDMPAVLLAELSAMVREVRFYFG